MKIKVTGHCQISISMSIILLHVVSIDWWP